MVPSDVRSPDPFTYVKPRSPKRLLLKPCTGKPETIPAAGTRSNPPKNPHNGSGADRAKERPATPEQQRSSTENCACCDRTTSEESIGEDKKKLRPRIIEIDATTVSNVEGLEHQASSLIRSMSNVCVRIDTEGYETNARKYEERNEIPCSAQCWMAKAYINVADDESVKTLTESESDIVTLSEKINVEDVCEARNVVEIRSCEQTINQQEFASSSNVQQFKKQAEDEITISKRDEIIKERDEIRSLRDVLPQEADQEEVRATTTSEVANEEPILNVQETEPKSSDGIRVSPLKIILKSKKERRDDGQEDETGKILPSTVDAVIERSTNMVPMSKAKKKIKFHIVSLMTNTEYDKSPEYEKKQKIEKKIAMNERETNAITDLDIKKLSNHRSIENLLKSAVAHNIIAGKDYSENISPKKIDLPKLCFDHQCQATFKEDKTTTVPLSKANIFPPFKNLHKHVTGNWFLYIDIIFFI